MKREKITFVIKSADGNKRLISFFPPRKKLTAKRGMNLTIHLTKEEINHVYPNHTFYDCCYQVEDIMKRIQKEIKKRLYK